MKKGAYLRFIKVRRIAAYWRCVMKPLASIFVFAEEELLMREYPSTPGAPAGDIGDLLIILRDYP